MLGTREHVWNRTQAALRGHAAGLTKSNSLSLSVSTQPGRFRRAS